ncbi:DNA adenine methylase [Shewanella marisflavi]|uniref:DNA adenine methylase n=1 Tax=Shewanella marisflavi TaxID=260364 RepID=UPI003AABE1D9
MEPLLKWPGSKRKLVGRLAKLFNEVQPRSVFEPFSGAATLSLHFEVETAYINDINLALINFVSISQFWTPIRYVRAVIGETPLLSI